METALQKLKDLKKILDWNLATKSWDILPVINEVILLLEAEAPLVEPEVTPKIIEEQRKQEIGLAPEQMGIKEPVTKIVTVEITQEMADKNNEVLDRAREYLKAKKVKGFGLLKENNLLNKAIENGFII